MKEVLALLQDPAVRDLATVDNGKPRVRPFGFMFEENGKYYFCTNSTKNVRFLDFLLWLGYTY